MKGSGYQNRKMMDKDYAAWLLVQVGTEWFCTL